MLLKCVTLCVSLAFANEVAVAEDEAWFSSLVEDNDDDIADMFTDFTPNSTNVAQWTADLEQAMEDLLTGASSGGGSAIATHEADVATCSDTHLGSYAGGGACYQPYQDCLDGLHTPVNALKEHNQTLAATEASAATHCANVVDAAFTQSSYCCGATCTAESATCSPGVLNAQNLVCHEADISIDWNNEGVDAIRAKIATASSDSFMAKAHGETATLRNVIGTFAGYDAWKNESDACNAKTAEVATLTTEKATKEATLAAEKQKCVLARQVRDACIQAAQALLVSSCQAYETCVQDKKDAFAPTLAALKTSDDNRVEQFDSLLAMICLVKHCATTTCEHDVWQACVDSGDGGNHELVPFADPVYPSTPAVCNL